MFCVFRRPTSSPLNLLHDSIRVFAPVVLPAILLFFSGCEAIKSYNGPLEADANPSPSPEPAAEAIADVPAADTATVTPAATPSATPSTTVTPTLSFTLNSGASYSTSLNVTVNLTGTEISEYWLTSTPSCLGTPTWIAFDILSPNVSYALTSSNANNTVYGQARSSTGTTTECTFAAITHDSIAPTVAITTPVANGTYANASNNTAVALAGTCSEGGRNVVLSGDISATVLCASNHTWSTTVNLSALANGTITVNADHSDAASNAATQAVRTIIHDKSVPTVTVTTPATDGSYANASNHTTVTIAGTCSEVGRDVTLSGDLGTVTTCLGNNTWTTTFNISASGDATFSVTATHDDVAGNAATPATRTIIHDKTVPTVSITTPGVNGTYAKASNNTAVSLGGACSENGRNVVLSGDVTATIACAAGAWSTTADVSALANGTITINADHSDIAANAATQAVRTIVHDKTPPTVAIGSPSASIVNGTGTITYTITYTGADTITLADGNVTVIGIAGASCSKAVTADTATTKTVTLSSCTGNGTVGISIAAGTSSDTAGNTDAGPAGPSTFFSVDTTAPTGGSIVIAAGAATSATANVALALSAVGASQMYITNTAGCGSGGVWDTYATSYAGGWTLTSSGTPSVYVKYKDTAGNESACYSDSIVYCASYSALAVVAGNLPAPSGDTYIITTALQLAAIGANATTLGYNYVLGNDISLACYDWTPIGDYKTNATLLFTGTFNGAGYTVSDMHIDAAAADYRGFFGWINSQGVVSNLKLERVSVYGGAYVGALAGAASGIIKNSQIVSGSVRAGGHITATVGGAIGMLLGGRVQFLHSAASVTSDQGYYTGGLIGIMAGTVVGTHHDVLLASSATGAVVAASDFVGGLVGTVNTAGVISRSKATGNVTATGYNKVGGLVGINQGTISRSFATGTVTGADRVGGLVGSNTGGMIANSYSTGAVTGDTNVGGFVGYAEQSAYFTSINHSYSTGLVTATSTPVGGFIGDSNGLTGIATQDYWDVTTSGYGANASTANSDGGTGYSTANMKTAATFRDTATHKWWDTTYVWNISDGSYPTLKWETSGCVMPTLVTVTTPAGSGTLGDPYLIRNEGEWAYIGTNNGSGIYYRVTEDIDFDCIDYPMPSSVSAPLSAIIDGNGHTIYNIITTNNYRSAAGVTSATSNEGGAIGKISWDGVVKNIKFTNVDMASNQGSGIATNSGTILYSTVTGNIAGNTKVGGIAGEQSGGGSYSAGNKFSGVIVGLSNVGGLAGYSTQVVNSAAQAAVHGSYAVGGAIGYTTFATFGVSVLSGSAVFGNQRVGGLIGYHQGRMVSNNITQAEVFGRDTVGGLIGEVGTGRLVNYNFSAGYISASSTIGAVAGASTATDSTAFQGNYWDNTIANQGFEVNGGMIDGAAGLSTVLAQLQANYAGWDFVGAWNAPSSSYPSLKSATCLGAWTAPSTSSATVTTITTPAQFAQMRNDPAGTYTLGGSIDMSCIAMTTMNTSTAFTGTFDGASGSGYTVSNLTVYSDNYNYGGLFGKVDPGGTISNLKLVNTHTVGYQRTGGIVGNAFSSNATTVDINNVLSEGTVIGLDYGTGGIAGRVSSAKVYQAFFNGSVLSDGTQAGGIVGWGDDNAYLEQVGSKGIIIGRQNIGGIVGGISNGNVTECYSHATVFANLDTGGGLEGLGSGFVTPPEYRRCYTIGDTFGSTDVNPVSGSGNSTFPGANVFWSSDSFSDGSGAVAADGASKTDLQLGVQGNFEGAPGYDFGGIWKMGTSGFPEFQFQP